MFQYKNSEAKQARLLKFASRALTLVPSLSKRQGSESPVKSAWAVAISANMQLIDQMSVLGPYISWRSGSVPNIAQQKSWYKHSTAPGW